MPDFDGPWGGPEPARTPVRLRRPRFGLVLWLALLGLALGGFGLLAWLIPGQIHGDDWGDAARLTGLLALVSSGLVFARRVDVGRTLRHAAIWASIGLAAVAAYTFRDDAAALAQRLGSALFPAAAQAAGPHTLAVSPSDDGHFYVMGEVAGQPVRFLIDTGASDMVLSPDDARRIGFDPAALKFDHPVSTANGVGYGATIIASSLAVGPIRLRDVPMSVDQTPMPSSLLGMSFLRRLDSFEIKGGRLYLSWRG